MFLIDFSIFRDEVHYGAIVRLSPSILVHPDSSIIADCHSLVRILRDKRWEKLVDKQSNNGVQDRSRMRVAQILLKPRFLGSSNPYTHFTHWELHHIGHSAQLEIVQAVTQSYDDGLVENFTFEWCSTSV